MPFRLLCQAVAGVALSTSLTACHMSTTSCRHAGYRCAVGTAVLGFSVLPWNRCARGVNRRTAVKKNNFLVGCCQIPGTVDDCWLPTMPGTQFWLECNVECHCLSRFFLILLSWMIKKHKS